MGIKRKHIAILSRRHLEYRRAARLRSRFIPQPFAAEMRISSVPLLTAAFALLVKSTFSLPSSVTAVAFTACAGRLMP